ncbi:MAG: CarD family transcriptional regulator [Clostridia bacterium]|nr:CarD family transcriptional regulator [Clostridia bacterium]
MFNVGEYIVYGGEGVCKIEDIGTPDIFDKGETRIYYTLAPLYRQGKIYTPVDTKVTMRRVISHDEAITLIQKMPEIEGEVYENRNVRVLSEHYQDQMRSHECIDLVKTIKAIYAKRELMSERGKKLGQIDEKFFKKAEDLLYGEFAVALAVPKEDVRDIIMREIDDLH